MTSSGRYAYVREILSKKATKIVFTIKRLLSDIDYSEVETRKTLFDALVKPVLLYGCEIRGPELLSCKTHFDKSTIEQNHIKFCLLVHLKKHFNMFSKSCQITVVSKHEKKTIALEKKNLQKFM